MRALLGERCKSKSAQRLFYGLGVFCFFLLTSPEARADAPLIGISTDVPRNLVDSSGSTSTATGYTLDSGAGETAVSSTSASGYNLYAGLFNIFAQPGSITSIVTSHKSTSTLTLNWLARGLDGGLAAGTSGFYRIEYTSAPASLSISTDIFTSTSTAWFDPASSATANSVYVINFATSGLVSGTSQYYTLTNLSAATTYYAAVFLADETTFYAQTSSTDTDLTFPTFGCQTEKTVCKSGVCDSTTIDGGLAKIPTPLTGYSCVVIEDNSVYGESVTVQGFTMNGSSLTIMTDPAVVGGPAVVDPPAATAAFQIMNASITITNINIVPTNAVSYGIDISSDDFHISSVTINDPSSHISNAGIYVNTASSGTISQSSVTVAGALAYALHLNSASSNTVTQSYISDPNDYGAFFYGGNHNSISLSTVTSNSGTPLYLSFESSDTVTQSYISAPNNYGAYFYGGNHNSINLSTMTSNTASYYALYLLVEFSDTITQSYMSNSAGYGTVFQSGNHNSISLSTVTSGGAGFIVLYLNSESSDTVTQSYISNPNGSGAKFQSGNNNSISLSTVTGGYSDGLFLQSQSSDTVSGDYVQGSTAVYVSDSTGTVIGGSVIVATNTTGAGVYMDNLGGVNLTLSSNAITGGAQGHGIFIDKGNSGIINLSTNTITGAEYGLFIATQSAGTQVWITSNTILPGLSASNNTYGVYLNGLTTGATIYNNGIYYRTSGSMGSNTSYGLYAQSTQGLNFHHNRIDEPGMITAGSFVGAYFNASNSGNTFKFNDVNSTGTGFTNAYLMELAGSTVTIRDNIFLSSFGVTGSSASFFADSVSGLNSDYNDWFSSNSLNAFSWGGISTNSLSGWTALSAADTNSIAANPFWFNPVAGAEDFHPMSAGNGTGTGRCSSPSGDYGTACTAFVQDSTTSLTIDAADPAEGTTGPDGEKEPAPNGCLPNQGSTGQTGQASTSVQTLSVSISTNLYTFSTPASPITIGVVQSTISLSQVSVTNNGNTISSYTISGATIAPVNSITQLGTLPGPDTPVLQALFNSVQPSTTDFEAVMSTVTSATTPAGIAGGDYSGDQSGAGVNPNISLGMWFRILPPTSTIYNDQKQTIQVTITAESGGLCTN